MANNPLNLALRFLLELVMLFALGYWSWTQHSSLGRWLWTLLLPLLAAAAWGAFRVPADHGKGLVAVPGLYRLLLEIGLFAAAVWALNAAGRPGWGLGLAVILLLHYTLSYDRVLLLLRN